MSSASSEHDPVNQLAEEFLQRYRRGEHPSVTEYARQYPQLADRIHDVFPALVVVEEFASVGGQSTGPHANATMDDRKIPRHPPNDQVQQPAGLQDQDTAESRHARPVCWNTLILVMASLGWAEARPNG